LQLRVQYQTKDRLNVQIYPANIPDNEQSWYKVSDEQLARPLDRNPVGPSGSDWIFSYVASPFSFTIKRKSTGDVVFSTAGSKLVFQNQFIEFKSSLPATANIYGLGDAITENFALAGLNRTIWAADIGDSQDANLYGAHPFYLDHRYIEQQDGSVKGFAHGVYSRNFHGQDILVRNSSITWRAIGGSIDLYFFSGPTPASVTQSYVTEVGLPALQQYWTLGFHQCRWGYANISDLDTVVKTYRDFDIPLETIWSDIDYMNQ
jgi:alpha-glucosidase